MTKPTQLALRQRHLHRILLAGVWREPVDPQPGPGGDQLAHRTAGVSVQAVPDHHERAAELLVRGVQQAGVVRLGEVLALVVPASAIDLKHRIIPDAINLPGAVLVYATAVAAQPDRWAELLIGGLAGLLFLGAAWVVCGMLIGGNASFK